MGSRMRGTSLVGDCVGQDSSLFRAGSASPFMECAYPIISIRYKHFGQLRKSMCIYLMRVYREHGRFIRLFVHLLNLSLRALSAGAKTEDNNKRKK